MSKLYEYLICYRENQNTMMMDDVRRLAQTDLEEQTKAELLTKQQEQTLRRVIGILERFTRELKGEIFIGDSAFDEVKKMFSRETDELEEMTSYVSRTLENVFLFLEEAFGESQEMVAFVTELNANYYSTWFIRENGCDLYYRYNKGLLFEDRRQDILRRMDEAEGMLNSGIK